VSILHRDERTVRDLQAAKRAAGACGQRERQAVGAYERACAAWVVGRGAVAEVEDAERALDAIRADLRRTGAAVHHFAARVPASH
jgi:hypothetical protein